VARRRFGADLTAVVWRTVSVSGTDGVLQLAASAGGITAWTAQSGGTQVTDLTDSAGNPIATLTASALGLLDFFGPATTPETVTLWLDVGAGTRQLIVASDLAAQVLTSVQQGRTLTAGTGLTGGGDLSADRSLAVVPNSTTQRVEVAKANTLIAARKQLNLIDGTNLTWSISDNPGSDRLDVQASVSLPSGGGYATVQDEGAVETARTTLNFTGGGVSVTDDPTNGRTNVVITGTATILPRPACLVVAGNDAPAAVKAGADYVCDGSADQVEINAALTAAFRQSAGTYGMVQLIGNFVITGSIVLRSANVLCGVGPGAILKSVGMGAVGMVVLADKNQHMTTVRDLTLYGNFAAGGSSHGVFYVNSDGAGDGNMSTNQPGNNPDASHRLTDVYIYGFSTGTRHGIYLGDNCRETQGARLRYPSAPGWACSSTARRTPNSPRSFALPTAPATRWPAHRINSWSVRRHSPMSTGGSFPRPGCTSPAAIRRTMAGTGSTRPAAPPPTGRVWRTLISGSTRPAPGSCSTPPAAMRAWTRTTGTRPPRPRRQRGSSWARRSAPAWSPAR
jgi:hypothetical protein